MQYLVLSLSDLIEEIAKCQRGWMYLEPIFASDDIHKQLPKEGEMFEWINTLWCDTLKAINEEPNILDLLERDNIKFHFDEANKKLDKINKSLSEYLEQKRLIFPRFYFIANEDLLMILAETKNPRKVQPHKGLTILFTYLAHVVYFQSPNTLIPLHLWHFSF